MVEIRRKDYMYENVCLYKKPLQIISLLTILTFVSFYDALVKKKLYFLNIPTRWLIQVFEEYSLTLSLFSRIQAKESYHSM